MDIPPIAVVAENLRSAYKSELYLELRRMLTSVCVDVGLNLRHIISRLLDVAHVEFQARHQRALKDRRRGICLDGESRTSVFLGYFSRSLTAT